MPLVPETTSGLKIKVWFERMLNIYEALGLNAGSVFRNKQGKRAKASQYEYDILSRLVQVQRERPDLIPETVNVFEELGLGRTFRRSSNTQARENGVKEDEINLNNNWSLVEHAKGWRPVKRMQEHYTDVRLLLKKLLRYSWSL
jgi:hypothetical protein